MYPMSEIVQRPTGQARPFKKPQMGRRWGGEAIGNIEPL
jgi:hypothetical protein